jgi:succinylarginine dihydrolase
MWTANAATVFPSCDTSDGKLHLLVANLSTMPHRSLEPPDTYRVLRRIFSAAEHFVVHPALPSYLGDEGAANQLRLETERARLHLLGWGKSFAGGSRPANFIARQSREASLAARRLCQLPSERAVLWQQDPLGIDAGAFHSDVLALSHRHVLLLHERAFLDYPRLLQELERALGPRFVHCVAREDELDCNDAVGSYPFNSQLVSVSDGSMLLIAPEEAKRTEAARRFLERVTREVPDIAAIHYIDVNSSMKNGGGPACLRLRVLLSDAELAALDGRVLLDDALSADLEVWIQRHYRDELTRDSFRDPDLLEETQRALDELTQILRLGSIYEFQQSAPSGNG